MKRDAKVKGVAEAPRPLEEIQGAAFRDETCEITKRDLALLHPPCIFANTSSQRAKERSEESSCEKTELIDSIKETIVLESNGRSAQCQIIFYS